MADAPLPRYIRGQQVEIVADHLPRPFVRCAVAVVTTTYIYDYKLPGWSYELQIGKRRCGPVSERSLGLVQLELALDWAA